ncbi:hypothetical protein QAD02_017305 [Eretmocerus hayati]|uniref:Uncharacterized protein n=1 Tax=Eretmocerus hayati TaxID=131215 RepID=A0ACC2PEK6_9HYME|nr:hypothetical protein QAD02_017305 [Eretmocerus hayati]
MPLVRKPMRYAHPEGHTDVCYFTGGSGGIVTCGTDGDVRAWVHLMDDDPSANCISDQVLTVLSKGDSLYVGTDNNTVQILSHPDLEKQGIVTRFSAPVCALATSAESDLIVAGACDMRIQVSNIKTKDNFELNGHDAPILGLSLDPKEEFIASSSGDGTIKVWSIKDRRSVHTWNVVPKCNSFFTAKAYAAPSFQCKIGEYLAYPQYKEVVVVMRNTWKEAFKLRTTELKHELSICKFSECGTLIAASSVCGEIVVWDVDTKVLVGVVEHQQNAKITSLAWKPEKPSEIAFCDALGQLSCVDVQTARNESPAAMEAEPVANGHITDGDSNFASINGDADDDDDDDDNVISLSKIKASVLDEDHKSLSDVESDHHRNEKQALPEVNLQKPFQPGSTPAHLLSRYMVWNDVGIVMCFNSEDDEESNIEVSFNDVTVHHSMHINNYLGHTMAALSVEALILAAPPVEDAPSKVVVVALQGWGTGNKEWIVDLPDGEEAEAVAAGDCFVAVATSARIVRLFLPGGTQREVVAVPGPVVAMNGHRNNLAIAYHSSIGAHGDQMMSLLWIRVLGPNLKSYSLHLPLSRASNLMWLGFSDLSSPVVMDSDGIINLYDQKARLWRVASNTNRLSKGKLDSYFIIGINESDRIARCILCKGSHYPPTTPRPIVMEVPLTIPLCEPESEKSEKEAKVWQLGSHPLDENEALLSLISTACRKNAEFRAVEICKYIASQKLIEIAIKYALRLHNTALANKLQSIGDTKESDDEIRKIATQEDIFNDQIDLSEDQELSFVSVSSTPDVEIRPLTPSQNYGRRSNPFLKKGSTPKPKGLSALDELEESPKPITTPPVGVMKAKKPAQSVPKKESFLCWLQRNKESVEKECVGLDKGQRTKVAFERFKAESARTESVEATTDEMNKKRKLCEVDENEENCETKRTVSSKLEAFARQD